MLPRSFYNRYLANSSNLNSTAVNGVQLVSRQLIVDPYSFKDTVVLSYLISDQDLSEASERLHLNQTQTLTFSLSPIVPIPEFPVQILTIIAVSVLSVTIAAHRILGNQKKPSSLML